MSSSQVDQYLSQFDGPGLTTAIDLRKNLLELLPMGEEGMSYGIPVVKLKGHAVAGYAIAKNHVGYYPHSSMDLDKVPGLVGKYKMTKGALQIPSGELFPIELLFSLVSVRTQLLGL